MTPLSKLWLFLVTLGGGLLLLALLVLMPELQRARREDQENSLKLAQGAAKLLLAEQAQRLVAAATQLASDAVLQTTLEEMARGQAELAVLHSTAQKELQKLSQDKALGSAFLLVTDSRGRVLARVGQDEAVYRDALDGWPLVSDALRGYRLDDLWLEHGTLYRVAAAPVVAAARDRYVGALLVAQVVGNDLALALSRMSALDAVFLGAGQAVGASLPRERLAVDELLALRAAGPPERVAVWPGRGEPMAFVDLPGTAANQGAALVLIGRSTAGTSAWELLRGAAARGLPLRLLLSLIAGMAVVFALGLWLLRIEVEGPLERLLAALQRTGAATAPALPPETRFRGPLRALVRAFGDALMAVSTAPVPSPPSARTPPAPAPALAAPAPALAAPAPALAAPAPAPAPPAPVLPAPAPVSPPEERTTGPSIALGTLTSPSMIAVPAPAAPASADAVPALMPTVHSQETRVADSASAGDDLQAAYFRVYQDFVLARERCQESVEGLNFDLFRLRLEQSREQIMQQHSCQAVQFNVHVKDGRATLRATPIWR